MGIEAFGESLLAQQRERNRRRRKDQERSVLQKALMGLGVTIGNKILAQKTQDFMNGTEFRSAYTIASKADALAADNARRWEEINASNTTPLQFLIERHKPIVEEQIKNETPFNQRGTQQYQGSIYKAAKEMAEQELAALTKMRAFIEDNTLGKDQQRLNTIAKETRPSNVRDALLGTLTGFFEGFSGSDADEREILALKDYIDDQDPKSRGYLLRKFQHLGEEYQRSRDFTKASQYAEDIMSNRSDPAKGREVVETKDFITAGDKVFQIKIKTTYNIGPEGERTQFGQPERELMKNEDGTPLEVDLSNEKDRVRANMESFNWADFAEKNFIGNATSQIFSLLRSSDINTLSEIDTDAEYKLFMDIFMDVASNPSNYKLGEAGKVFFDNGIKWWHDEKGDGSKILSKIKAAEGRGEDTTELRKEYDRAFADYARNLREEAVNLPQANRPQGLEGPASAVSAPTRAVPTLEEFLEAAKARPENKDISEQELRNYYFMTYGNQ